MILIGADRGGGAMQRVTGRARAAAAVVTAATVAAAVVAGCGWTAAPAEQADAADTPLTLAVTPEPGTGDQPLSTEIGTTVAGGVVSEVSLEDETGASVPGRMRADGSAWVPDRPLSADTSYRATVTAAAADGRTVTEHTRFTTMPQPQQRTATGLYLQDGHEYGVAMPVAVEFRPPVPPAARAGVQRRMFVHTSPPQPGVWHWVADGGQAFYRAPEHWRPGTRLDVRIALAGHPTGGGRYGDRDRVATATIGSPLAIEVDNAGRQMTVGGEGVPTRTMPVSLGKPSTPSSSGNLVVMSKEESSLFDTTAELGTAGYRVTVAYALRLTWQGEYIHAAPWSVADQGVRNVSHGCVNLSTADAEWLFGVVKVGDPVTVTGTEVTVEPGNGWTAWELGWDEFIAGSALPVPDDPAQAALATTLSVA